MEHGKYTHVPNNGAKRDSNTHVKQLGMKRAMMQAHYERGRFHTTNIRVEGKTVDIIHRISGQEEEILRSELRKVIRDERDHNGRNRATAVTRPPIPVAKPDLGSHANDTAQPTGEVTPYGKGQHHTPSDAGVGYAVMGQHGC